MENTHKPSSSFSSNHSETIIDPDVNEDHVRVEDFVPGVRFNPDDGELINKYLYKKIMNLPMPYNRIKEVRVYDHCVQVLTGRYPPLGNKWYFFTPRDRKHLNGTRPNRQTGGGGFWRATSGDIPIVYNKKTIGSKKTLVFYEGKSSKGKGVKTNWIMHEFKLNKRDDVKFDDLVLCRIYKREVGKKESADNEDDDERPSQILPTETDTVTDFRDNNPGVRINESEDNLRSILSNIAKELMDESEDKNVESLLSNVANFEVYDDMSFWIDILKSNPPALPPETASASNNVNEDTTDNMEADSYLDLSNYPEIREDLGEDSS